MDLQCVKEQQLDTRSGMHRLRPLNTADVQRPSLMPRTLLIYTNSRLGKLRYIGMTERDIGRVVRDR